MATLRELLGNRILQEKHYYDKRGYHKGTVFMCLCPNHNCVNHVKIDKHSKINTLCRSCSLKGVTKKIKRTWQPHTKDLKKTKSIIKYPDRFIEEEVRSDLEKYRVYYRCTQCDKNKTLNILCVQCANENKKKRPYERTYNRIPVVAAKRGIPFSLSYEEFAELCKQDCCYYCKEHLNRAQYKSDSGTTAMLLDRIDSNKGYSKDNCVPCCARCNDMKGHLLTFEEMVMIWEKRLEDFARSN